MWEARPRTSARASRSRLSTACTSARSASMASAKEPVGLFPILITQSFLDSTKPSSESTNFFFFQRTVNLVPPVLQPDFTHCAQSPEHHHRPASCHGELLLRPLARLSRWHTLAICCSRSASSSPHSCHGAVTTHLLAGLSRAGSPAGATRRPLSLVHHGPQRPASSVREEAVCRHSRAGASGS